MLINVRITFDPAKRDKTLAERGLDFAEAAIVFAGVTLTLQDDRRNYGEPRFQSYGLLGQRLVMVVWTPRGSPRDFDEEVQCPRKSAFRSASGLTRTTRRNGLKSSLIAPNSRSEAKWCVRRKAR